MFLFNDVQQLVMKANDDLVALIKVRISEHQKAEAHMLKCVTTPFVVTEKVSRLIEAAGRKSLADDPPESDDDVFDPSLGEKSKKQ